MRTLKLCLSICVVILFCSRGETTYPQITKTLRSGKSTIGPVFVTVSQKPENEGRNLRQVLIRFSGPPDTSVNVDGQQRTKVQDSDKTFVSEFQHESVRQYDIRISFYSKTTSERLLFTTDYFTGHFAIYPSCNLDVTSTDVGEITTYTIQVTECREESYGRLRRVVSRNGEIVPWEDYLTIEENQDVLLVENATTVSFNRSQMMNEDAKLKYLSFILGVFPNETFSRQNLRPWYQWSYSLI